MKTKDNKKSEIGDILYYAKEVNGLMAIQKIVVSNNMNVPVSECYTKKDSVNFLCVAANCLTPQ